MHISSGDCRDVKRQEQSSGLKLSSLFLIVDAGHAFSSH